jgi:hypothetical protein
MFRETWFLVWQGRPQKREGGKGMFYSSRFLTALSELEGFITHQKKSDEDAMFDAVKQSKSQGLKPAEAALSYFVTHASRGVADEPDKWGPVAYKAALRVKGWLKQNRVRQEYADPLFHLVRNRKTDEA